MHKYLAIVLIFIMIGSGCTEELKLPDISTSASDSDMIESDNPPVPIESEKSSPTGSLIENENQYQPVVLNFSKNGLAFHEITFVNQDCLFINTSMYYFLCDLISESGVPESKIFSDLPLLLGNVTYPDSINFMNESTFQKWNLFTGIKMESVSLSEMWQWLSPDKKIVVQIDNNAGFLLLKDAIDKNAKTILVDFRAYCELPVYFYNLHYLGDNIIILQLVDDDVPVYDPEKVYKDPGFLICGLNPNSHNFYPHGGAKFISNNGHHLISCNTLEYAGEWDSCENLYKIEDGQLIQTKIPIGANVEISFNGEYILRCTVDEIDSGWVYNYQVYSYQSEELIYTFKLNDPYLKRPQSISIDGNKIAITQDDGRIIVYTHK